MELDIVPIKHFLEIVVTVQNFLGMLVLLNLLPLKTLLKYNL